jgi:hypothetical protein
MRNKNSVFLKPEKIRLKEPEAGGTMPGVKICLQTSVDQSIKPFYTKLRLHLLQ